MSFMTMSIMTVILQQYGKLFLVILILCDCVSFSFYFFTVIIIFFRCLYCLYFGNKHVQCHLTGTAKRWKQHLKR